MLSKENNGDDRKRRRVHLQKDRNKEIERARKDRHIRRYFVAIENKLNAEYGHIIKGGNGPVVIRWTITSANCYFRHMNCKGCPMLEYCERAKFALRGTVRHLVRNLGVDRILKDIPEQNWRYLDKESFPDIMEENKTE